MSQPYVVRAFARPPCPLLLRPALPSSSRGERTCRGGDRVVASLGGPVKTTHTLIVDRGNGSYSVFVEVPTVSGQYVLSVSHHGDTATQIHTHKLRVLAPCAQSAQCKATGIGLQLATAGEVGGFSVTCFDVHGSRINI